MQRVYAIMWFMIFDVILSTTVCEFLDKEKREHEELKQTWHMANDQFLEAQRMQAEELRRIQSILTAEQQKAFQGVQHLHIKRRFKFGHDVEIEFCKTIFY